MPETQDTITAWAIKTFGPIDIQATAIRGNVEMAELGSAISNHQAAAAIRAEAADVAIVLCQVAEVLGHDVEKRGRENILADYGVERADLLKTWTRANTALSTLLLCIKTDQLVVGAVDQWLNVLFTELAVLCAQTGGYLWPEVERKMRVNRGRTWGRDPKTGQRQHVEPGSSGESSPETASEVAGAPQADNTNVVSLDAFRRPLHG